MQVKSLILIIALSAAPAIAQTAGQDIKNAGSDTKHATTSAGKGIEKGTKTGYHKTVSGTKKGYHKTAHVTKKGVHKVEGKPDTPLNNPPR
jgi:hypothetical protein